MSSNLYARAIGAVVLMGVCIPLFSFSVRIGWPAEGEIGWALAAGVVLVVGVIGAPFGWWFGPQQSPQRTSVPVVGIGIGTLLVGSLFALGGSVPFVVGVCGAFAIGGAMGAAVGVEILDHRARLRDNEDNHDA